MDSDLAFALAVAAVVFGLLAVICAAAPRSPAPLVPTPKAVDGSRAPKRDAPDSVLIANGLRNFEDLPYPILFVDTETTGLTERDRVVTLGAILLRGARGGAGGTKNLDLTYFHFIFSPGVASHPRALAVHGHPDDVLARQEEFAARAGEIGHIFEQANLVVGHNIDFDLRFLRREMLVADRVLPEKNTFCTMKSARDRGAFPDAKLSTIARSIGVPRGQTHRGALEDAWIAMNIYFKLEVGHAVVAVPFSVVPNPGFENFRA